MALEKDVRYAKAWFGITLDSPLSHTTPGIEDMLELPCKYRGETVGVVKSCASCPLFVCTLHGSCTKQRDFDPQHMCCRTCPDRSV